MPTLEQILAIIKENQLILGLLASAVIGAMPEALPKMQEFPQWAWTWFRDSAKTFLNFRFSRNMPLEVTSTTVAHTESATVVHTETPPATEQPATKPKLSLPVINQANPKNNSIQQLNG
jgi:hypothetical protein